MKKINKILIYLPDLKGGGAEKVYTNLANSWNQEGLEVIILLNKKEGEFLNKINQNIKIIDLKAQRIRRAFFLLPRVIKKEKPDIVLTAMWPLTSIAIIVAKLFRLKTKLVISDHVNLTMSIKKETNINFFIFKLILKFSYKFADGIICVSEGVKKNIINISGLQKDKITVINNPVLTDDLKNLAQKYKNHKKPKTITLLSVGTLKEQKNHELLIRAFSLIENKKDIKLTILGDGPKKNDLINLITEKKQTNRIQIKSFDLNIEKHYLNSHIFVLSSDWEGFGNVLVEAMHYGLDVISTNCNYGPSEILQNGKYGKLVKTGDINELREAINQCIKNYSSNFINHNHQRSLDFLVSKISKKYISYFQTLV